MNWFNRNDLKKLKLIDSYESSITGYVLPHAGTKYTIYYLIVYVLYQKITLQILQYYIIQQIMKKILY